MTLDDAIKHAEDVAFYKENFENLQRNCNFCWFGRDIMGWIETCRHPDNVPIGSSWGDCTKEKCPYYQECIECASEHRQLAEWLRELKALKDFANFVAENVMEEDFKENSDFYAEVFCRKLHKMGFIEAEDDKWIFDKEEVNADE